MRTAGHPLPRHATRMMRGPLGGCRRGRGRRAPQHERPDTVAAAVRAQPHAGLQQGCPAPAVCRAKRERVGGATEKRVIGAGGRPRARPLRAYALQGVRGSAVQQPPCPHASFTGGLAWGGNAPRALETWALAAASLAHPSRAEPSRSLRTSNKGWGASRNGRTLAGMEGGRPLREKARRRHHPNLCGGSMQE